MDEHVGEVGILLLSVVSHNYSPGDFLYIELNCYFSLNRTFLVQHTSVTS